MAGGPLKTDQQYLDDLVDVRPTQLAAPALDVFMDYGSISAKARAKTLILVVTTAFAWVTAGQVTVQLFDSFPAFAAAHGAATQLLVNAGQVLVGAVQNVDGAGLNALPLGKVYRY